MRATMLASRISFRIYLSHTPSYPTSIPDLPKDYPRILYQQLSDLLHSAFQPPLPLRYTKYLGRVARHASQSFANTTSSKSAEVVDAFDQCYCATSDSAITFQCQDSPIFGDAISVRPVICPVRASGQFHSIGHQNGSIGMGSVSYTDG
jgi:hypothetical protein